VEREQALREGCGKRERFVGIFEDSVEEFVGERGEVIDSRGRLRRRRGKSAWRDSGETWTAYLIHF